eukprot:4077204-Prymnesium_polylepis.1
MSRTYVIRAVHPSRKCVRTGFTSFRFVRMAAWTLVPPRCTQGTSTEASSAKPKRLLRAPCSVSKLSWPTAYEVCMMRHKAVLGHYPALAAPDSPGVPLARGTRVHDGERSIGGRPVACTAHVARRPARA